jgi:hypothetical protein
MSRSIEEVARALATHGPPGVLEYLNDGVPHRYTAVYRRSGAILHNVLLHDKQRKRRPEFLALVPYEHSYCQYVVRDGWFRTDDSSADMRLQGHPLQGLVVSYQSVPIHDHAGKFWGTLCHLDMKGLSLPDPEFELLRGAAELLQGPLVEA